MVTIDDVARHAGVSKATVSHVINNTRPVLPATRQAVLEAIQQLKYRPSAVARSLNTRVTHTIGILVADITNSFFGELVRHIERQLSDRNYNLIVCNTDEDPEREARYLSLLLDKWVDGLIVAPAGVPQPIFQEFIGYGIPLVFVDRRPPESYGPVVAIDNFAAGYTATEYLIRLGHRLIAIITRSQVLSTARGRLDGYRQALLDHHLPVQKHLIEITDSTPEAAFIAALRLLALPKRPTAIVATNHIMTLGMLQAVHERRLSCPDNISLIGFDEHPWAPLHLPPLTVVKQPITKMCDAVVKTLYSAIDKRKKGHNTITDWSTANSGSDILLEAEFVIRASCSPLSISSTTSD
jgi:LacI family transcriptional regulator